MTPSLLAPANQASPPLIPPLRSRSRRRQFRSPLPAVSAGGFRVRREPEAGEAPPGTPNGDPLPSGLACGRAKPTLHLPAAPRMNIAPCTRAHAPEILAIFNHAILHTTALYEYAPRTPEFMAAWFDAKDRADLPVLGAFDPEGALTGFATYGPFRTLPAYQYTVEHSVYVREDRRGRGVARALLGELVAAARAREVRVLVGVIDADNAASLGLHRALGFVSAGKLHSVGYKFGRWLDVELVQLTLRGSHR